MFFFKSINPLVLISLIPLFGIIIIFFIPKNESSILRRTGLFISCLIFLISLIIWVFFCSNTSLFQFSFVFFWIPYLNLNYTVGLDGISLFFLILTTFLIVICILCSWNSVNFFVKEFIICFLFLEFCLIQVFCVLDLFLFYIFFESVLIPMFLIVGIWGSRERKIRAAYQFFLYTLLGSFFMLMGLSYIYTVAGTTDIQILWFHNFSEKEQLFLWSAFFLSFAVKIPMMPFHIWLPEAHAEAPTPGSIILAGVLLKLGGYGFIRFSLPLFPKATVFFTPLIFTLSVIAIIYGSLTTLRQIDLKKIIAYSSVSHMGFVTLGIFSLNTQSIAGSIFLMLSHGLVSSALFFCIGILYDRYKTRILKYYGGLVIVMPLFVVFLMFFLFSNIGFPGTSSFIGEFLILMGAFQLNPAVSIFSCFGIILAASYSIWLLNRISFLNVKNFHLSFFQDISRREFWIIFIFFYLILFIGIFPNIILNDIHFSVLNLLEHFFAI